jgi:hypothetical protein
MAAATGTAAAGALAVSLLSAPPILQAAKASTLASSPTVHMRLESHAYYPILCLGMEVCRRNGLAYVTTEM